MGRLRRAFGSSCVSKLSCIASEDGLAPILLINEEPLDYEQLEAIGLLGWQESAGAPRLWDITLLGGNEAVDIVTGHDEYLSAEALASELARTLGVPLQESSCVGGTQVPTGSGSALSAPPRRCCN